MKITLRIGIHFFVCYMLVINSNIIAQTKSTDAFSRISFNGSYLNNMYSEDLGNFWNAGHGGSFNFATNFYAGEISIGINYLPFSSLENNRPDFKSYYFFLGWSQKIRLISSINVGVGAKLGSFNMIFEDNTLSEFEKNESEFAIGAFTTMELGITDHISIFAGTEITNVFTNKQLKFWNAYSGLTYTINTPSWLKNIFR